MIVFKSFVLSLVLGLLASASLAQSAACDTSTDPHSYACQELAYEGRAGFPLLILDWGQIHGEWFATTFAGPNGGDSGAFRMDVNRQNPRIPGRGVLNVREDGFTSVVGSVFLQNNEMIWQNFHGKRLDTGSQNFGQIDQGTVQITTRDGDQPVRFECRMFLRNNINHLTCKFMYLHFADNRWLMLGYLGFLTRADWDSFVASQGGGGQQQPTTPPFLNGTLDL